MSPRPDGYPRLVKATSEAPPELLAVGLIARAHGVRGEVSVQPLSEVESRFEAGSVLLVGPAGERQLTVDAARPHGRRLLVKFDEVDNRDDAEALRGRLLLIRQGDSPQLPQDHYWVHELVGLEVVTESGRSLGTIREVLHNPANDVWLVEGDGREFLIPALREVVAEVDPSARRAVIREVPGLLEEDS